MSGSEHVEYAITPDKKPYVRFNCGATIGRSMWFGLEEAIPRWRAELEYVKRAREDAREAQQDSFRPTHPQRPLDLNEAGQPLFVEELYGCDDLWPHTRRSAGLPWRAGPQNRY